MFSNGASEKHPAGMTSFRESHVSALDRMATTNAMANVNFLIYSVFFIEDPNSYVMVGREITNIQNL